MRAEDEAKLNQIEHGKIIKHNGGGQQQRARHQRRARQFPTAAEIQTAVRKKADEPRRQKINCRQRRPRQHQAGDNGQNRDGQQFRLPRAPKRLQVGAVEKDDLIGRIRKILVTEQRKDAHGLRAEFDLHVGRRMDLAAVIRVNDKRKKPAFGEELRRVAGPIQPARVYFTGDRQISNGSTHGRETAIGKKPDHRRGRQRRDDELHEQQAVEPGVRKSRHAARRQRFPRKS